MVLRLVGRTMVMDATSVRPNKYILWVFLLIYTYIVSSRKVIEIMYCFSFEKNNRKNE